MDSAFVFIGFLLLVLLFGPWIGLAILRSRSREFEQQFHDRFSNLTQRIYALEAALREFQSRNSTGPIAPTPEKQAPQPEQNPATSQRVDIPPTPIVAPPPPRTEAAQVPPIPAKSTTPPPALASAGIGPAITASIKKEGGLEEVLGKNWLNKLGIILLVLGIAFFLAYQLKTLGPGGKVLVGYLVSGALLGTGIRFESNDRYRILARAGIAGGWALLFFTTYAMHHVPAARVLSSQTTDLILMLIVALAMVWHTLRYNSQVVTGLAFLLAYSTVFISHVNVYSLSAGVILAIGIVLITLRRSWFELEVFGILGSYLNHYFWLRPIIEPMGDNRVLFAEFLPSVSILACYWVIYRVSYVVRTIETDTQESVSALSALLNTVLILGLLKYQAVHPDWAFWTLLVAGAVELALGHLPITKRRRMAFVVLSTIGAVLLVAAVPFRYSGAQISVIWLFEAEALFLIGLGIKEILFARLGLLAAFVTAGQMLVSEAVRVFDRRVSGDLAPDYRIGLLVLGVAALIFYANVHYFSRRWPKLLEQEIDRQLLACCSYVASVLAIVSLWMAFPELWTAVAWSALAIALFEIGVRLRAPDLRWQCYFAFFCVFLRVCFINLNADPTPGEFSTRAYTILLVTAAFFYCGTRHPAVADFSAHESFFLAAQSWMGAITLAALIRLELPADLVITGWALFTLVLMAIASWVRHPILKHQALLLSAVIFLRALIHNFPERDVTPWNPASLNVIYAAALLFGSLFFAFHIRRQEGRSPERGTLRKFIDPEQVLFFVPLAMITILLALEMRSGLITVSWGIEAVVVFLFALWVGERSYRLSGLFLLLLCVGKIVIIDVWGLDPRDRYITFIIMGIAVLLVSFLYTRFSETIKKFL